MTTHREMINKLLDLIFDSYEEPIVYQELRKRGYVKEED